MTAQEILEKLPSLYEDISEFAYGESIKVPTDFTPSEALLVAQKEYNELYKEFKSHPGYKDRQFQDDEFNKLSNKFYNTKNPDHLIQDEYLEYLGIGKIEEVEQHRGEGEGERWWSVKFFPRHNVFIKVRGHYTSYHGTDFDYGWGEEVKPQEKIITVYETIG